MDRQLEEILSDNKSGSTEIALKLNKYFLSIVNDKDKISGTLKVVKEHLGSFSIISYYSDNISQALEDNTINDFISTFESDVINSNKNIYNNAKKYLSKFNKVYTLSNSNTITELLKFWYADNAGLQVYISESRPAYEGRLQAKALFNSGMTVHYSTDGSAAEQIKSADVVLIGADKVLANGDIINKTGSLSAAICCRHFNKPFFVAASKFKYSNDFIFNRISNQPEEIWQEKHQNLKVDNFYFEEVPAELITKIFSD